MKTSINFLYISPKGYPDYDGGAQVNNFAAQMISPDNSSREVYKGHDRDCIVAGLLPGRPYLFQVRAFNRTGVSHLTTCFFVYNLDIHSYPVTKCFKMSMQNDCTSE